VRGPAVATALGTLALLLPGASAATPTWLPPATLSPPLNAYANADVAVDAAGDAVAVWIGPARTGPTYHAVETSSRPAGGNWSQPVAISSDEPPEYHCETCLDPHVAIDASGKAYAVWSFYDPSNPSKPYRKIVLRTRSADGTWASRGTILSTTIVDNESPRIAASPTGDVGVVWHSLVSGRNAVQGYFRSASGTSFPAQTISNTSVEAFHPDVGVSAGGNTVATFFQGANSVKSGVMNVVTRAPAGPWSSPKAISAAGVYEQDLAVGPAGDAAAVWSRVDGADMTRVEASVRPAGSSGWSPPTRISAVVQGGAYVQTPQVAVGPTGLAAAVWVDVSTPTKTVIDGAVRPAGAASVWGPAVPLSAPGVSASVPRVAVSAAKTAVAIWSRGLTSSVVQSSMRSSGGWTPPVTVSGGDNAGIPAIAVDSQGNAVGAWPGSDGMNTYIRAAGFDAAGPGLNGLVVPANGVVGHRLSFAVSPFDVWSALGLGPVWVFGDGGTGAGTTASHTYAAPGTYAVTVSQADAVGNTSTASRQLTVTATPVYCVVPKVVGKTLTKAKAALKKGRCRTGKVSRAYSKRTRKGRVVAEQPKAGRRLPVGSKVRLVISRGQKPKRR
jgi:hypothetical protein